MRLWARLAFLVAAIAPVAAFGDNAPQVVLATPGLENGAITRFTARFSQPMVPLGDPRAAAPFKVTCPTAGQGRWADQQTFVYDFAGPLPGGTKCTFEVAPGTRSTRGFDVTGTTKFTVDAGGPTARSVLPSTDDDDGIEEDQVFLVAANMPADPRSVAANAYCAVDGIGEKIAVDVLPEVPAKLLPELTAGGGNWSARNFLEEGGLPQSLPADAGERARALASVTALKCRRPLPPGRDMALVWSGAIAGAGGKTAGADQRFDFTVRKPFTARFTCSRVNAAAGCSPVQEVSVNFTAPVPSSQMLAIRLVDQNGKQYAPKVDKKAEPKATMDAVIFAAPFVPQSTLKVVLPDGLKDESGRVLANAERFPLPVQMGQAPPLAKFAAGFGILEAKEGGVLPVTVRNVEPALTGKIAGINGASLRVAGSDGQIAQWLRTVGSAEDADSHTVKRAGKDVEINDTRSTPILPAGEGSPLKIGLPGGGKAFEVVGIPLGKPGFYVIELASPTLGQALLGRRAPRYVATAALVTNMAVHFKWGRERSLAWVTALNTGKPVANAQVQISDACSGALLARGATDGSGGLFVPRGLPAPTSGDGCESSEGHPLIVSARAGDDMSFTMTSWSNGIAPYDFDLPYGYSAPEQTFHTVFDRTLVRQGETIHMKHLVRVPTAAGFGLAQGFTGTLQLKHRGSDTSFDLPLTIDAAGSGETSWTAPKGAPLGDYDLRVIRGDRTIYTDQSFKVDEYKLPTMRATVTGPKAAVIRPKSLPLDLFVGYLSGGAAASLPVTTRIGWSKAAKAPADYSGFTFGGDALKEGVTPYNEDDEDGSSTSLPPTATLPATLGADGTQHIAVDVPPLAGAMTMRVEMDYQDANGETLTASNAIPIYPSAVQLGIKTDGWLMRADDLRLRVVTLDLDGKPMANQHVAVALYSRQILTARRRLIGGFYAYDNQVKVTKLSAACDATTDELGYATCKIDPGVSGEVYAVATTQDSAGNEARAVTSVWLAGDDEWWFGGDNGDRMDVIAEQPAYKAGETARFQVRMPFRAATALVTVEREGVLTSFVTELSGSDPVIEVPMPGDYAPDVYVSVMAVRGRVSGGMWDWIEGVGRAVGLVRQPAAAPEPTALVDLAKPAYRMGVAKVKVGWDTHRLGVTVKADHERYAARGQALADIAVTRPDGTPAASADVAFVAVDQAILQISPNDSWDLLTAMMGDRPLSVLTSTAQMQVVGKRHYGRKAVEAGGGGGGDAAALNRQNFQPVLLWQGHVALDANGHARVPVPLSDALTSFKLVAVASDGTGLFGEGETSIRTAQDLTVYAGMPTLVRGGDFYTAGFTLRNGSDRAMTVTATVDLQPAVATGHPLTVTIPAGGAKQVGWNLTAPDVAALKWHVSAREQGGKGAADQLTVSQDVVPLWPVDTWAATLARVSGNQLPVAPPAGALAGLGSIDIALTDTLAPPMGGVRSWMGAYPYDCFEQRLSRAVALGDQAAWTALAAEIPAYQADDGLLRYWPSASLSGSEALTAYVLSITAEAGLPIPDAAKARMVEGLKAVLDGRVHHESYGDPRLMRATIVAALARAGAATPDMPGRIGLTPAEMPTATLADYLVALDHIPGLANANALRVSGEGELRKRLAYEGTRLDITDKETVLWWLMSSSDEAAIKALVATLGRPGWQDDGAKMMVGVALRQLHGHWDTTPANAWGAVAVAKFARLYPASAIAGTTTLTLAGASQGRSWPLAPDQRLVRFPLPASPATLGLAQSGGQGPWAMVSVRAAVPVTSAVTAGYRIAKDVSVVSQRVPGHYSRGDVLKVTITVQADAERNWVVVNDPIPAGATIIGDQANQSQLLAEQGQAGDGKQYGAVDANGKAWEIDVGVQPAYVERGRDAWRSFYSWVPRGAFRASYLIRLNGAGRFALPATRVEAMYSPSIFALQPNAPITIEAR